MDSPKVYLDSTVLKFSATLEQTIDWGGRAHTVTVHDEGFLNPNDGITNNPNLKAEAELFPVIASLAREGRVSCVVESETELEVWGLPKMDSEDGPFYGAPVKRVDAPFEYGRVVFAAGERAEEMQFEFLSSITHTRFLELQRITGAYQGPGKLQRNQLLDAYHIWCAEHNRCEYFLCLDFKLQKVIARSPKKPFVSVVTPSELLAAIIH